jgi:hypothetical protein
MSAGTSATPRTIRELQAAALERFPAATDIEVRIEFMACRDGSREESIRLIPWRVDDSGDYDYASPACVFEASSVAGVWDQVLRHSPDPEPLVPSALESMAEATLAEGRGA